MAIITGKSTTPKGERDYWRTPRPVFDRANRRYGRFMVDVAANATNHLCSTWFGPDSNIGARYHDALTIPWQLHYMPDEVLRCWCNPPYSQTARWVAKALGEAVAGRAQTTLLVPATTDVRWWHDHIWQDCAPRPGVLVQFLNRVAFNRPNGTPSKRPQVGSVLLTFLAHQ